MATPSTTPAPTFTLSELAAAQHANPIFAYAYDANAQQLARLQNVYARKRAEFATFRELMEEATPDLILRAADGRQLVLRLAEDAGQSICYHLSEKLSTELRGIEARIVHHLRDIQAEADWHHQLTPAELMVPAILALCAPGDPALPTPGSVWLARADAAEALEEQLQQQHGKLEASYGREILWHPRFPAEYVTCVSGLSLFEVVEFHEALPGWCNQQRALDGHDYQYLLDCLSEALASQPTELAALRLRRALAWVEQARANPATWLPTAPAVLPTPELAPAA